MLKSVENISGLYDEYVATRQKDILDKLDYLLNEARRGYGWGSTFEYEYFLIEYADGERYIANTLTELGTYSRRNINRMLYIDHENLIKIIWERR